MTTFEQLGISEEILQVLNEMGFEHPTEIQEKAIPQLIKKEIDCIGLAQTGTGKTAAFGLPLLQCVVAEQRYTQALVLAPTRELGQQIAEQLYLFSKYLPKINVLAVYGGANIMHQISDLKREPQHIIIATPGRLRDLINRRAVDLSKLKYIVLDEADEMLNMGFKEELDEILTFIPKEKNTWLFSATMPPPIKRIVDTYMNNPIEFRIDAQDKVNPNIDHQYAVMKGRDKTEALKRFLDIDQDMRGVVFCRTKNDTQELAEELLKHGYKADALHGDMTQQLRTRVMKRFKDHELQVLIATDVAARGIDVNDLTHVFHYSLPDDNSYYTHRSGRTARAGKKGISLCFVSSRETGKIRNLERQLAIDFTKVLIPQNDEILDHRVQNWCELVLAKSLAPRIKPEIFEKMNTAFANLSKEELAAKLVSIEIEKMSLGSSVDLNEAESSSRGGGSSDRKPREFGRSRSRGANTGSSGGGYPRNTERSGSGGGYPRNTERSSSSRSESSSHSRPANFRAKSKAETQTVVEKKSYGSSKGAGSSKSFGTKSFGGDAKKKTSSTSTAGVKKRNKRY